MRKNLLMLICILLMAVPSMAQDLPDNIRETAIGAAQNAVPGLGRPASWRYSLLMPVSDSTLGCPLAIGFALDAPTTPYVVTLVYADGREYTLHISADASIVVLCDTDFGQAAIGSGPGGALGTATEEAPSSGPAQTGNAVPPELICPAGYPGYLPPRLVIGPATAAIEAGGIPNTLRSYPVTDDAIGQRLGTIQPGRTIDNVLAGPACNQGIVWWLVQVDGARGWTAESNIGPNEYYIRPLVERPAEQNNPNANVGVGPNGQAPLRILSPVPVTMLAISSDNNTLIGAEFGSPTIGVFTLNSTEADAATGNRSVNTISFRGPNRHTIWTDGSMEILPLNANNVVGPAQIVTNIVSPGLPTVLRFSEDNRLALTTDCSSFIPGTQQCQLGAIKLWDAATMTLIRNQPAHPGLVRDVQFSPDGTRIASLGDDGIQIWDTTTGAFITAVASQSVAEAFNSIAFTPDRQRLIVGICNDFATLAQGPDICLNSSVQEWVIETGLFTMGDIGMMVFGNLISDMDYSPNDRFLALGAGGGMLVIRDLELEQNLILDIGVGINTLAFSPNSSMLVVALETNEILVYQMGNALGNG